MNPGIIQRLPLDSFDRRWLEPRALAALGVLTGFVGVLAWTSLNPLIPIAALVVAFGAAVLIERPDWGLGFTFFVFYINLQPVLSHSHGVSPIVAALIPAVLVAPLLIRNFIFSHHAFGSQRLYLNGTLVWMGLYMLVLIAAAWSARDAKAGFSGVVDFGVWGLAFYLLILNSVRRESMLRQAIWALLAAGAFLSSISLFQEVTKAYHSSFGGFSPMMGSFLDAQTAGWRPRPAGPVGDPNRYAQVLLVLVPLGLFRVKAERGWLRYLAAGLTLLTVAGVLLTFSRGAGLALALLLPIAGLLMKLKLKHMALAAVLLLALVSVAAPDFVARMATLGGSATLISSQSADTSDTADHSTRSRLTKNLAALHMFFDHPLLGVGPGNFGAYSNEYAQPVGESVDIVGSKAHNLVLGLLAETGVLGLLTFCGAVAATLLNVCRVRRGAAEGSELLNMANSLLLALAAYGFSGIFLHLSYQRYFWFLMALAGTLPLIVREHEHERALSGDLPQPAVVGLHSLTASPRSLAAGEL
jgi:putative inorganic carbon (HCO3(-)) transporter